MGTVFVHKHATSILRVILLASPAFNSANNVVRCGSVLWTQHATVTSVHKVKYILHEKDEQLLCEGQQNRCFNKLLAQPQCFRWGTLVSLCALFLCSLSISRGLWLHKCVFIFLPWLYRLFLHLRAGLRVKLTIAMFLGKCCAFKVTTGGDLSGTKCTSGQAFPFFCPSSTGELIDRRFFKENNTYWISMVSLLFLCFVPVGLREGSPG